MIYYFVYTYVVGACINTNSGKSKLSFFIGNIQLTLNVVDEPSKANINNHLCTLQTFN